MVARDNTVAYEGRRLQLPGSPARAHYVKATSRCANIRTARSPCSTARAASPATARRVHEIPQRPDHPKHDTVLAAVKDAARRPPAVA